MRGDTGKTRGISAEHNAYMITPARGDLHGDARGDVVVDVAGDVEDDVVGIRSKPPCTIDCRRRSEVNEVNKVREASAASATTALQQITAAKCNSIANRYSHHSTVVMIR